MRQVHLLCNCNNAQKTLVKKNSNSKKIEFNDKSLTEILKNYGLEVILATHKDIPDISKFNLLSDPEPFSRCLTKQSTSGERKNSRIYALRLISTEQIIGCIHLAADETDYYEDSDEDENDKNESANEINNIQKQKKWLILSLVVEDEFQRIGYGTTLMIVAIKILREITENITVYANDERLYQFYQQLGFRLEIKETFALHKNLQILYDQLEERFKNKVVTDLASETLNELGIDSTQFDTAYRFFRQENVTREELSEMTKKLGDLKNLIKTGGGQFHIHEENCLQNIEASLPDKDLTALVTRAANTLLNAIIRLKKTNFQKIDDSLRSFRVFRISPMLLDNNNDKAHLYKIAEFAQYDNRGTDFFKMPLIDFNEFEKKVLSQLQKSILSKLVSLLKNNKPEDDIIVINKISKLIEKELILVFLICVALSDPRSDEMFYYNLINNLNYELAKEIFDCDSLQCNPITWAIFKDNLVFLQTTLKYIKPTKIGLISEWHELACCSNQMRTAAYLRYYALNTEPNTITEDQNKIIKQLLNKDIELSKTTSTGQKKTPTAIQMAVKFFNRESIISYLVNGFNPDYLKGTSEDLLIYAVRTNDLALAKKLIERHSYNILGYNIRNHQLFIENTRIHLSNGSIKSYLISAYFNRLLMKSFELREKVLSKKEIETIEERIQDFQSEFKLEIQWDYCFPNDLPPKTTHEMYRELIVMGGKKRPYPNSSLFPDIGKKIKFPSPPAKDHGKTPKPSPGN